MNKDKAVEKAKQDIFITFERAMYAVQKDPLFYTAYKIAMENELFKVYYDGFFQQYLKWKEENENP